ncbi:MAG: DNA repair protein RecN [Gammaproteobacteria bacterium]|nr:MAG: DNA repair protein RecN [Gammaproteobacteria bacterium]
MITQLYIRDFVLVDTLDLALSNGMTSITGETGAGKSILLDAIGLVLGDRANINLIRPGAKRAEVMLDFDISNKTDVINWLVEHEVDEDDACQIRRTVSSDGRSRAYINGSPVTVQWLRELGEKLIDIHGQHAHQSIMHGAVQRELLDAYAEHADVLKQVSKQYRAWQKFVNILNDLQKSAQERDAKLDLLRYQLNELVNANLIENEWDKLETDLKQLANAGELREACHSAMQFIDSDNVGELVHITAQLGKAADLDGNLKNAFSCFENSSIQIQEASGELRNYLDSLDDDPQKLNQTESRISELHSLARKHHVDPNALLILQDELSVTIDKLDNDSATLGTLEQDIEKARDAYLSLAKKVSKKRKACAKKLGAEITHNMQQLGMPEGVFEIALHALDEHQYGAHGLERVEFLVSANPGQELMAMTKVASGGELSRISLAIQVINVSRNKIGTYIFDEVDVGVGGGIAEIIGQTLRRVGDSHQVLCVTHLPQVAALGHHQLKVEKAVINKMTNTNVTVLSETDRLEEIARMLAGTEVTDSARKNAQDLISRGGSGSTH